MNLLDQSTVVENIAFGDIPVQKIKFIQNNSGLTMSGEYYNATLLKYGNVLKCVMLNHRHLDFYCVILKMDTWVSTREIAKSLELPEHINLRYCAEDMIQQHCGASEYMYTPFVLEQDTAYKFKCYIDYSIYEIDTNVVFNNVRTNTCYSLTPQNLQKYLENIGHSPSPVFISEEVDIGMNETKFDI